MFNNPATTEIYTLSLHDALPISGRRSVHSSDRCAPARVGPPEAPGRRAGIHGWPRTPTSEASRAHSRTVRSEEHTSELQSRQYLVCRLLLEKNQPHTIAPCPLYS